MDILNQFLPPSLLLFATGLIGVMFKRNLVTIFMCVEIMLCGAMLAMITFAAAYSDISGAVFAFFALAIGAAEVAVGLAIIPQLFRVENTVSTKNLNTLGD